MDSVTRSRSSSHVTSASSDHVVRPPTPPVFGSRLGARSAADEGFTAVLQDINKLIRAEGYNEELPRQGEGDAGGEDSKSTHVDGQYTDGHVTDGDNDSQIVEYVTHTATRDVTTGEDGAFTTRYSETTEVREQYVQDDVDADQPELYAQVIRTESRPERFSDVSPEIHEPDWDNPPAIPLYTGGDNIYSGTSQPLQGQPPQGQPLQGQPLQGQPFQGQPLQDQPFQGHDTHVGSSHVIQTEMNFVTIHGESTQPLQGVMARVDREVTHPDASTLAPPAADAGGSSEWQESVLQMGEDWEQGGDGYSGQRAVGDWAQHQATSTTYNMYQTPRDNTTATVVTVNGDANLNTSLDRRSVNFSPDTRENEGLSKRYGKEGFRAPGEMWSSPSNRAMTTQDGPPSYTQTNTWPHPARSGDVSVVMTREEYNFPSSGFASSYGAQSNHGRVFSGTLPTAPPAGIHGATHAQTFPRPGAIERGIQLTDSDTWQRHADNTSVINIDTPTDGRSAAGYSIGPSIAGYSGVLGTPHGSLNRAGSPVYPTMLTTAAAYQNFRNGIGPVSNGYSHILNLQTHRISSTMEFGDEEPLTEKPTKADKQEKPNKDRSIAIEKRQRLCRIITFAVIAVIFIAVIIGVILGVAKP